MYMSVKHIKRFVQFKIKKIQSIKILFWDFFCFFTCTRINFARATCRKCQNEWLVFQDDLK